MHEHTRATGQLPIDAIKKIACHFFDPAQATDMTVRPAEAGLSGSQTYILKHLQTGSKHVLKQLPSDLSIDQIRWTQALADFVNRHGHTLLPVSLDHHEQNKQCVDTPSKIAIHCDGTMWQCLGYIVGLPCKTPRPDQISLATEALADFHQKASIFQMPPSRTLSGWHRRVLQLRTLLVSLRSPRVDNTVIGATHTELHVLYKKFFQRIRSPKFTATIQHALSYTMPDVHQPVLRDCHWNHVLFSDSDDCVTGFIDIDAAGWDDPAVDISRLLGSWQLENPQSEEWLVDLWPDAFKQYLTSVNAGADFPSRVQVLHDTAILCGIDRWFTWLFTENRYFANMEQVSQRITLLLNAAPAAIRRLEHLSTRSDSN